MNTREIAVEYRLSQWAGIMRERQESGLSVRAFCERESIHENVYYYWQRKLREAAIEQMAKRQMHESGTVLTVSGFTEVQAADGHSAQPGKLISGMLQIETKGIKITADSTYPTEKLAALLQELSGL